MFKVGDIVKVHFMFSDPVIAEVLTEPDRVGFMDLKAVQSDHQLGDYDFIALAECCVKTRCASVEKGHLGDPGDQ